MTENLHKLLHGIYDCLRVLVAFLVPDASAIEPIEPLQDDYLRDLQAFLQYDAEEQKRREKERKQRS